MSFEYSQVAILVFLLYVTSTGMVLYNKWMVNWCPLDEAERPAETMFTSEEDIPIRCPGLGFPYPLFIATMQFLLHTVIGFVIVHVLRLVPIDNVTRRDFWLINLQGACVGCFVGLANLSFLFIDASLFEEIRQLATVFTLLISYMVGLEKPSWRLLIVILMIAGGVGLAVAGEEAAPGQMTGIIWVVMSCVVTALSNVLVQILVQEQPATPSKAATSLNYNQLAEDPDLFEDEEDEEEERMRAAQSAHTRANANTRASAPKTDSRLTAATETLSLLRPNEDSTGSESSSTRPALELGSMDALAAAARDSQLPNSQLPGENGLPAPASISIDLSGLQEEPQPSSRSRAGSAMSSLPPVGPPSRRSGDFGVGADGEECKYAEEGLAMELDEETGDETNADVSNALVLGEAASGRHAALSGCVPSDAEDAGEASRVVSLCCEEEPDAVRMCGERVHVRDKVVVVPTTSPHNSKAKMHPVLILYLHSPASMLVLLPFLLFVELPYLRATPLMVDSVYTSRMLAAVAAGGLLAFVLQWVHYKLTSVTSAITLCVVGTCKTVVVVAAGVFTFQNKLSLVNILGFMICFLGLLLYAKIRATRMGEKLEGEGNKH